MTDRVGSTGACIGNDGRWTAESESPLELPHLLLGLIVGKKTPSSGFFILPHRFQKPLALLHPARGCADRGFELGQNAFAFFIKKTRHRQGLVYGGNHKTIGATEPPKMLQRITLQFGKLCLSPFRHTAPINGDCGDRSTRCTSLNQRSPSRSGILTKSGHATVSGHDYLGGTGFPHPVKETRRVFPLKGLPMVSGCRLAFSPKNRTGPW